MNIWTLRPGWDALDELQKQMDRLFDFTVGTGRQLWQSWRQLPAFNLYETPAEYTLVAPLPGIKPEEIEVTVAGNTVTLKGERSRSASTPEDSYRRQERWMGKWTRTFQAPDKADLNNINASVENGLLVLHLAKAPESQPRQVPVKVS